MWISGNELEHHIIRTSTYIEAICCFAARGHRQSNGMVVFWLGFLTMLIIAEPFNQKDS